MTRCAPDCGACCNPVLLPHALAEMNGPSAPFARKHWTEIPDYPRPSNITSAVRCDAFDPDTRQCTAYAIRPPICSGFPWYGNPPDRRRELDPACTFQADVRTVLPLTVVNRG